MGSRRIGRKRLYALEKLGQSSDMTEGAGMAGAIGHSKVSRDGTQITTELYVDLGTSGGTVASSGSAGAYIIGLSSSTGTHSAAYLGQVTTAINGFVTDAEVICVEAVAGGEPDIDVVYASSATLAFDQGTGSANVLVAAAQDYADAGDSATGTVSAGGAQNSYLYLANGNAAPDDADYTAGKLVIRLIGYAAPDDV